jgi:HAMP domain-containing protein
MLRRKLLTRIGLLIGAFVCGAVVAIVLLQSVVRDIDRVNLDTARLTDSVNELSAAITALESQRLAENTAVADPAAKLEALVRVDEAMRALGAHEIAAPGGLAADIFVRIASLLPSFTEGYREGRPISDAQALASSIVLRAQIRELGQITADHVSAERAQLGSYFRLLVLGLTLAAIVMVNVSAVVLLHTVYMILRPVDQLVDASRELAQERFDHRVEIDQDDEFGELAHAYNRLAQQLAANEARKMETLRQVANHDLNNTLAAIELELRLVDLQTGGNPRLTERFQRMHQSLARVAKAVRSLAEVRRIVLTEYMPGQMMLDLERSVRSEDTVGGVPTAGPSPHKGEAPRQGRAEAPSS